MGTEASTKQPTEEPTKAPSTKVPTTPPTKAPTSKPDPKKECFKAFHSCVQIASKKSASALFKCMGKLSFCLRDPCHSTNCWKNLAFCYYRAKLHQDKARRHKATINCTNKFGECMKDDSI